ncbi:hypothetical protein GCM10027514_09970 [Azotobacter armeniacus]
MATKSRSRPNKAKSLVAQPLFRCRQEQPKKGKGSYRREAFRSDDRKASVFSGRANHAMQERSLRRRAA